MCGIAGFVEPRRLRGRGREAEMTLLVSRMADALYHRGPDDGGVWVDAECGMAFGHRRLAIIDVSPLGHQPMRSDCGRYTIIFNGEIYNHRTLRRQLEQEASGPSFRGGSDTEVMLRAISAWGLPIALERFNGMFAFALWDAHRRELHLVRDRLGEKPLYYGWSGDLFLFGSELKALAAHPGFDNAIDRRALSAYFRYGCVPGALSIHDGIRKVPPGTVVTMQVSRGAVADPVPYWSAREVAERGRRHPFTGSPEEAVAQLDALLRDAVRIRMEADVPLGAFLSGGIDSSTVVALMQAQSSRPVKTFTIGSDDRTLNEAHEAGAVATHLGTDHTQLYISPDRILSVIGRLPELYDEPFADSSQIPTFLVSDLARRSVTVGLSGDGGDEVFGGYHRHFRRMWQKFRWIPWRLRTRAASALVAVAGTEYEPVEPRLGRALVSAERWSRPADKLYKLSSVLPARSTEEMYLNLVSHWKAPASLVIEGGEPLTAATDSACWADIADPTERIMYLDTVTYLPDDILAKVDRASMGVSLEARVPLLDPRVLEFAWTLPLSMKVKHGRGKWLLRQVLQAYVPRDLVERPKRGFSVPIGAWLRGPLRDWCETLLDRRRLEVEGFLDARLVRSVWHQFLVERRPWEHLLWDVLMFQAWLSAAPCRRPV